MDTIERISALSRENVKAFQALSYDVQQKLAIIHEEANRKAEFRVADADIQWRRDGSDEWQALVPLRALRGPRGAGGKAQRAIRAMRECRGSKVNREYRANRGYRVSKAHREYRAKRLRLPKRMCPLRRWKQTMEARMFRLVSSF